MNNLENLHELDLSNKQLTIFPPEIKIKEMVNLEKLNLSIFLIP